MSPGFLQRNLLNATPRPISEVSPEVPSGLDAVVMRCLDKSPERRYQSARALYLALAEALGH